MKWEDGWFHYFSLQRPQHYSVSCILAANTTNSQQKQWASMLANSLILIFSTQWFWCNRLDEHPNMRLANGLCDMETIRWVWTEHWSYLEATMRISWWWGICKKKEEELLSWDCRLKSEILWRVLGYFKAYIVSYIVDTCKILGMYCSCANSHTHNCDSMKFNELPGNVLWRHRTDIMKIQWTKAIYSEFF